MKTCPLDPDTLTGENLLALRHSLKKNQTDFWGQVGVTQSASSRYESGRSVPRPTRIALCFTYPAEILKFNRS